MSPDDPIRSWQTTITMLSCFALVVDIAQTGFEVHIVRNKNGSSLRKRKRFWVVALIATLSNAASILFFELRQKIPTDCLRIIILSTAVALLSKLYLHVSNFQENKSNADITGRYLVPNTGFTRSKAESNRHCTFLGIRLCFLLPS